MLKSAPKRNDPHKKSQPNSTYGVLVFDYILSKYRCINLMEKKADDQKKCSLPNTTEVGRKSKPMVENKSVTWRDRPTARNRFHWRTNEN